MIADTIFKSADPFSGLATMVRIMPMYYVNCCTFFEGLEQNARRGKGTASRTNFF